MVQLYWAIHNILCETLVVKTLVSYTKQLTDEEYKNDKNSYITIGISLYMHMHVQLKYIWLNIYTCFLK